MLFTKKIVTAAVVSCFTLSVFAAQTYEIDSAHSFVSFKLKHKDLGMAHGSFSQIKGTIVYDQEDIEKSSVDLEIDAASLNTGHPGRDKHVKNPDYLDVEKYPTITFKSKEVKKISDDKAEVTGDVTLHGVTKPLTATISKVGETTSSIGIETQFKLKRTDFGVGKLQGLGEDIHVDLAVEAGLPRPERSKN